MLKELFYGKVIPWARRNRQPDGQHEIVRRIAAEEKYFEGILSDDDSLRFKALSGLYSELATSEEAELFSCGFSMGLLLMAEVANEAKTITSSDLYA